MSEAKHTPLPWNCAHAYSSVVGVPIINQKGHRVGNTALPDLPPEWAEMKERAVADAKLIVHSVNSLPDLVKALEDCAGCVDAAEAEGLHEVVEELRGFSEQTDRLIDLIERRLMWPRNYATEALTAYRSAKP